MNSNQRAILTLAAIVFVGMGLIPPWQRSDVIVSKVNAAVATEGLLDNPLNNLQVKQTVVAERIYPAGYAPLWQVPFAMTGSVYIDVVQLSVQWIAVCIGAGALFAASADRRPLPYALSQPPVSPKAAK